MAFRGPSCCKARSQQGISQDSRSVARSVFPFLVEAIAWLRNDQNKPEAIKIFGRFTRTQDEALLQRTYELSRKASRMVLYATEGGLRNILDFALASDGKNLAPENFLDNSFFRQLESSGDIKSLYGK